MDRRTFVQESLWISLGWSALPLSKGSSRVHSQDQQSEDEHVAQNEKFKQNWISSLMENLDRHLDEDTRIKLMESCGRSCARQESIKIAESCLGDLESLVSRLGKIIGKQNASMEEGIVHLQYDKCYCPLVSKGPKILSDTWCNCSRGWVKEMFETAAEKPVKVELLQSIKRGDPCCKFILQL